jgi:tRNA pseudouridine55 synthase
MDGLLIVDKPGGMSSHDVVNKVRRLFDEKSVGHLGTLDPLATGVLPLLLGRYTRLAQYFGKQDKQYTGRIRFGFATDTYDCEGQATSGPHAVTLDQQWLSAAVAAMQGDILQMPPAYSAKKINGVPAHRMARRGETPELKPVTIHVEEFTAQVDSPDTATFRATVSSGGYIRCLAHDLGRQLGCGAHLLELRRIRVGDFQITQAVTLETLAALSAEDRTRCLLPSSKILPELPACRVGEATVALIRNGVQVPLSEFSGAPLVRVIANDGAIVAIARRLAGTLFAPQTVLA